MKYIFCLLLIYSSFITRAQVVSGLYSGTIQNDSLKMVQNYELALSEYRGKITGYSYITFVANDTFYYGIKKIRATREDGNLVVEDVEMLMNNYPKRPDKGVHLINILPLNSQEDTARYLSGTWKTTQSKKHGFYSIAGNMSLKKDSDSAHSTLMAHLKELNIVHYQDEPQKEAIVKTKNSKEKEPAPTVAKNTSVESTSTKSAAITLPYDQRGTNIIQSLDVASDSLMLSFYDNGVVDGDTISVLLNNQNIISKTKLTAVAAKKKVGLNFDADGELKLTLIAENLGTIPPNTGLLVVEDGAQKHQIRFSADMQNNAAIIFRRKKQ